MLPLVEALSAEVANHPAVAHELPAPLHVEDLIGLDFLRGRRITLDFREGVIDLD